MQPLNLSDFTSAPVIKKVGYVALIGRPNAGKSTFINRLIDEKISAVSAKPQTTQRTIRGIYNDEDSQIIFFDTPGIHERDEEINIIINDQATSALKDADVIVRFIDSSRPAGGEEEEKISAILENVGGTKPIITVYSKMDIEGKWGKEGKGGPEPMIEHSFSISSRTRAGFEPLLAKIKSHLSVWPLYYPEDYYTDQDTETRIREVLREKLFLRLGEEIPYGAFVEVEDIEEDGDLLRVLAVIHMEKDSQKTIVIGKGGEKIKEIGTLARLDLEKIFGRKVFILLRVKTWPNWKKNKNILKQQFG